MAISLSFREVVLISSQVNTVQHHPPPFTFFFLVFAGTMTLRYPVFLECADQCADPVDADVFFGLAYGLMPFCVTDDANQGILLFRRAFGPAEKDKAARIGTANEELAALPEVRWYLAGASMRAWTDHMQPDNGAAHRVAWSIAPERTFHTHNIRRSPRPPRRIPWRPISAWFRRWFGGPNGSGTYHGTPYGGD